VYWLTKNEHPNKYLMKCIKCGLDELIREDIISKTDEVQKHYILDCSKLWIDTDNEKFTIITFQEVEKVFTIENVNNFTLLRYFVYLMGSLSGKIDVWLDAIKHKTRVVGMLTIDQLADLSGTSVRAIVDYNKVLEEYGLLYVRRQNDFVLDKANSIKQLPNIYGRPCDKSYIDAFAKNQKKYNKSYRYIEKNIATVNNNRRLAQMYQQLLKGKGEKYTKDEIIEIYNYVVAENRKYMGIYEKNGYQSCLDKIRDTNVFKKYGIAKEN
jgi:hypothetical protein